MRDNLLYFVVVNLKLEKHFQWKFPTQYLAAYFAMNEKFAYKLSLPVVKSRLKKYKVLAAILSWQFGQFGQYY